jgi:UDP-N-acetylmuramoyl-tripeptide--D-alanyl-D-alanine ligase
MKGILKLAVLSVLTFLAKCALNKYRPRIIAVTGSVGKTGAKDAIYSVVSTSFPSRKNPKSFNAEFGVPLTILNLPNAWASPIGWFVNIIKGLLLVLLPHEYPKWLVLEIGADHPGDIKKITKWVNPSIGVVTGLGNEAPVHVEFFPTIESLIREKSELLRGLDSVDSAIINRDDERAWGMRSVTVAHILSYGFDKEAKVRADAYHVAYDDNDNPKGIGFRVDYSEKSIPVRLTGVLGKGHAYAALVAFAVGTRLGINLVTIAEALTKHTFAPGRMRILPGLRETVLIDDSYNSSPAAVKLALDTLRDLEASGRKIAVLADMAELGEYSVGEHKKVGTWIPGVADVLVCVGPKAKDIGESASMECLDKSCVYYFDNSVKAGHFLANFVQAGDAVLLKGSQSMRMERATELLLADSSKAPDLLVRQEPEWKAKN